MKNDASCFKHSCFNYHPIKKIVLLLLGLTNSVCCLSQQPWIKVTNNSSEDFHASFSPDGKKILFDSQQSGHNEVYLYDTLTKETQQLTNDSVRSDHPTWFPDGRQILFTYWAKGAERYKMNVDGSNRKRLIENGYGIASPKGNIIS